MIILLSFAPIEFLGGVERQYLKISKLIRSNNEEVQIVCFDKKIANFYSRLVLGRKFETRDREVERLKKENITYLSLLNFIPFTNKWKKTKNLFKSARAIYFKFEIPEILTLFYFEGFKSFKKSIAAVRTPLKYTKTNSITDKINNFIYDHPVSYKLLSLFSIVHVLNKRDLVNLISKELQNVKYVPNGITVNKKIANNNTKQLNLIYVGELSKRKGVDILINIAEKLPKTVSLTIVGDGVLQKKVSSIAEKYSNVVYAGYKSATDLEKLYVKSDALIFPSHSETFGAVMIEAASYGLMIINSKSISLGMPENIELSVGQDNKIDDYLDLILKVQNLKKDNLINKTNIQSFVIDHYSSAVTENKLFDELFYVRKTENES